MINGTLEQFLDTGWYSESTLYYNGYVYWCEAQYNSLTNVNRFFVYRWAAENEDDTCFHSLVGADGPLEWNVVYEVEHRDLDCIKKQFLEAAIFDGKTFWQVEKEVAWLEEGSPITVSI